MQRTSTPLVVQSRLEQLALGSSVQTSFKEVLLTLEMISELYGDGKNSALKNPHSESIKDLRLLLLGARPTIIASCEHYLAEVGSNSQERINAAAIAMVFHGRNPTLVVALEDYNFRSYLRRCDVAKIFPFHELSISHGPTELLVSETVHQMVDKDGFLAPYIHHIGGDKYYIKFNCNCVDYENLQLYSRKSKELVTFKVTSHRFAGEFRSFTLEQNKNVGVDARPHKDPEAPCIWIHDQSNLSLVPAGDVSFNISPARESTFQQMRDLFKGVRHARMIHSLMASR